MTTPGYTEGELEIELWVGMPVITNGTIEAKASEPGEPATRNFDILDPVEVEVHWSIPQSLNSIMCGSWDCDLYFESMGEGKEFKLEGPNTSVNQAVNDYTAVINVPPKSVEPVAGETSIVYKLTVTVDFKNTLNKPTGLAGFVELPMVHFYKDV